MHMLQELQQRNEALFVFGIICFTVGLLCLLLSRISQVQLFEVSAWNKPLKFALSLGIYSWTMAWYCYYLPDFNIKPFNITVIILWSFELFYITLQAARGQQSHYNISTPFYGFLYALMAIAASTVTIYTAYIGILFFTKPLPELPLHYLWAIRLGIILFVIFSFQGFMMGSRLNHSIGALNNNSNLFIVGWSKTVGDLRVAHFLGMHALQILPLCSYYFLKNTSLTFMLAFLYAWLAFFTLTQALKGKPFYQSELHQNQ